MVNKMGMHACLLATSFAPVIGACADNAETANKSNNPLNLDPGMNLQDCYTRKYHNSNTLVRGTLPIASYIPLGLGGGKVWKDGPDILNASIEPQWTVDHKDDGLPKFKLFAGLNVTFGK